MKIFKIQDIDVLNLKQIHDLMLYCDDYEDYSQNVSIICLGHGKSGESTVLKNLYVKPGPYSEI